MRDRSLGYMARDRRDPIDRIRADAAGDDIDEARGVAHQNLAS